MSIIFATPGSGVSGLGRLRLPRTKLRQERRETRREAGRTALQRFGAVMTGGIANAATAHRVRERAEDNAARQAKLPAPATTTADVALQAAVTNGAPPPPGAVLDAALDAGVDLNSALRAAGITPDPDTAGNAIVDLRSGAGGGSLTAETIAQYPTAQVNEVSCLVGKLAEGMQLEMTQDRWEAGMVEGLSNPDGLRAAVEELGLSTEGCRPWYRRRITWIVGGSAVAAAVILKKKSR